jgi:hypothetical protein
MSRIKSYILGGATVACALGIGYVMQYGLPGQDRTSAKPLQVTQITPTSSAMTPRPVALGGQIASAPKPLPAATEEPGPMLGENGAGPQVEAPEAGAKAASAEAPCAITLTAEPAAGAMATLALHAPCHGEARVTLHHQGLMFTELTDAEGRLSVTVPVFAQRASFTAAFAGGAGASAVTDVTSLSFYDRVAVQWKGQAGLQLHAREFGADYFGPGHVWTDSAGDLGAAARGEGGFLVRLGRAETPEGLVAEVYSFPSGTAQQGGAVAMSVEAEVTAENCDRAVEAQTLEIREGHSLRVRDLLVDMPDCAATGDFLVLKNLVEDLNIAQR